MLKGADRNALDYEAKKAADYIPDTEPGQRPDYQALELKYKILKDDWSILGDCLMIRNTFKKQKKTPCTLICYFLLMTFSFGLLQSSSY